MTGAAFLSDTERAAVAELRGHYPDGHAAIVEALKAVQRERRWVPDEALPEIGALLGVSAHEIDGVATFYSRIFRRPVGRHVISVCDSVSCWVMGYDRLRAALEAELGIRYGQTTADGRFTLLPNCCLGACHRAPVMLVDGDLHEAVDPDRLADLLAAYG